MNSLPESPRWRAGRGLLPACSLAALLAACCAAVHGEQTKIDVLKIGTSGTFAATSKDPAKNEAALDSLKAFIREETGLDNTITDQKDWRELVDKMSKAQLHLGVFQGYEFGWAVEKYPELKPLALAVNVYRYPVVYVVVKKDSPVKDFAGLKSQALALPATGQRYLNMFVERQCLAQNLPPSKFFSKIVEPDNVEDALDDAVDGMVNAAVADRAALEAFKRRKPGRFNQLKELVHSPPLPPPLVAYYGTVLDKATLKRFEDGLLGASKKEKGQTMLTLFRLTGFEVTPSDFGKVLAETRKTFPPLPSKQ